LITILRNQFHTEYRKRCHEVEDATGSYTDRLYTPSEQQGRADMAAFHAALAKIPISQREALILVGALNYSYEETADLCGCAIGTIKSRVHRARLCLTDDFGPDRTVSAVIARSGRIQGHVNLPDLMK
jgi:RNA polymerase sigma-70 factor, ECF subfamily